MTDDFKRKTAQTLAEIRTAKGYTQSEMADLTGIKTANISRIEKGEQNLSLDTIAKYCYALNEVPELVVREQPPAYGENTIYSLKIFDEKLLSFEMHRKNNDISVSITKVYDQNRKLLPLSVEPTDESLRLWLKRRPIPGSRAYVHELLESIGLNKRDIKGIIDISKCLSINDSYWVTPDSDRSYFSECNLYDNSFSDQLGQIAFVGMYQPVRGKCSSPEFTTGGMLRKAWRCPIDKQGVWLYKGGSEGDSGCEGNEVYSEYYAAQIAKTMGLNAVKYDLEIWRGILTSCCPLFTNKNISYVPAGDIPGIYEIEDVIDYYRTLGPRFFDELCDMLVFDALILNKDRHFLNFGLLRDNQSGEIIAPAPIFDNGLSLFPFASRFDFGNLESYSKKQNNPYERSWEEILKLTLSNRQKTELKSVLNFSFTEHPHYNLPEWRLHALEDFLHARAKEMISY